MAWTRRSRYGLAPPHGYRLLAGVAIGSVAAGAGLFGLAVAWVTTTTLAYVAIKRSLNDQHKEWMIRSYVVTFAFETFRVIRPALQAVHVGTLYEELGVAAWACWAVPLLMTELVIQRRKILAVRAS